jgi:hypothetical protein
VADPEPFILAGHPDLLRALVRVVNADPDLQLVSVSGPPDTPERIVVRMPQARAEQLRGALGGQLIVEPDETVNPAG